MKAKFSTSTNIIRDSGRELKYIPTPNAKRVVNQLSSDFFVGVHSFNIIGSYGTGKSTFLWAFEQSLLGKGGFFESDLNSFQNIKVLKFIGHHKSILEAFGESFEVETKHPEKIFSEIFNQYRDLGGESSLLVLVIDEFGKFLEYASKNDPEKELYFIQQLSEFVNNPDYNITLITTVHQNFDAYAFGLNSTQRQEWSKVKGRFKEITFNEPIEQLLFLASESLNTQKFGDVNSKKIQKALKIAIESKAFNVNPSYAEEIAGKMFPLEIISANVLTMSLQKYGQNERSLFSFLETEAKLGINSIDPGNFGFFNIADVYDYLINNFYSFINSRFNPDFANWISIKNALETVERTFTEGLDNYAKIIKTIGLLNTTAAYGADLGYSFLTDYSIVCLGINTSSELINNLVSKKIIIYRNYNKRFSLFEGTDLDITEALSLAENKVGQVVDVVSLLKKEYDFAPMLAKSYSFIFGTPRLFEFVISEEPINQVPVADVDGFVNLVFSEELSLGDILKHAGSQKEAIVYGYFRNSNTIKNQLFEIEKTRKVLEENTEDRVAFKELNNILQHQKNLLNHYILSNLYNGNKDICWIFDGKEFPIKSKKEFNKLISQVCLSVYSKTPVFKNELVNRHKISPSIHTAKRNYLKALVEKWDKPDLDFDPNRFPPEKTIFLTLLKENGLEPFSDSFDDRNTKLKNSSFIHLWDSSMQYFESTKQSKKAISELSEVISKRPFKLKQGVVDFWIASFLFLKRDDFALFGESGYIPYLTDEILELVIKYPSDYSIKAFDLEGVKLDLFNSYRKFLNQAETGKPSNQTFIDTIKPFIIFYKGLTEYAKKNNRISKMAIAIRSSIADSKEPEKTFFEDFPSALGYSISKLQASDENFHEYIGKLQEAIREIRASQDQLYERVESFITDEFIGKQTDFIKYKEILQQRFNKLRRHLCLPHQKTFLLRLDSQLDDRNSWLNSLCQAIIGKSLEMISDKDEVLFYDKFKAIMLELDSLNSMSSSDFDEKQEEIFEIEMSSFGERKQKKSVRLPKAKIEAANKVEENLKQSLSNDKTANIYAVANLLKKLLKE
jgi:hypothetical protein